METEAPASSSFFLTSSASCLETFSITLARSGFHQVLGFLQAEVRTDAADFLDHVDLLVATGGQDNGELGLLFSGFGRSGGGAAGGGHGDRSGGGDAPLFFQQLGQLGGFQDGQGRTGRSTSFSSLDMGFVL